MDDTNNETNPAIADSKETENMKTDKENTERPVEENLGIGEIMARTMRTYASHMAGAMCAAILALATLFCGCASVPSVETMNAVATSIGVTSGTVCGMTKIDDASRNAVVEIMTAVDKCVPTNGQSFASAWTPVAKEHIQKLVADKKLDEGQAVLVEGAFGVACNGIDYLFDVRFPKAKEYKELVETAVHGFTGGFLSVFKPADAVSAQKCAANIDKEAYDYLVELQKAKK